MKIEMSIKKNDFMNLLAIDSEELSHQTCQFLLSLIRNLDDPESRDKTESHPILKQCKEILDLIYSGEK